MPRLKKSDGYGKHLNDAVVEEIVAGMETSDDEGGSSSDEDDGDDADDIGAFDMIGMDEAGGDDDDGDDDGGDDDDDDGEEEEEDSSDGKGLLVTDFITKLYFMNNNLVGSSDGIDDAILEEIDQR